MPRLQNLKDQVVAIHLDTGESIENILEFLEITSDEDQKEIREMIEHDFLDFVESQLEGELV